MNLHPETTERDNDPELIEKSYNFAVSMGFIDLRPINYSQDDIENYLEQFA